jgi:hypothetical protein
MVRRARAAVAALVLLGQLAAGVSAAAAFWLAPEGAPAVACRCPHAGAATAIAVCPMHKTRSATHCTLKSTSNDDVFVLASLLGTAGVLPASVSVAVPVAAAGAVSQSAASTRSLRPIPDAPPPRA